MIGPSAYLQVGNTPLIKLNLPESDNCASVWLKVKSGNPPFLDDQKVDDILFIDQDEAFETRNITRSKAWYFLWDFNRFKCCWCN